jgi:hypothetical protein
MTIRPHVAGTARVVLTLGRSDQGIHVARGWPHDGRSVQRVGAESSSWEPTTVQLVSIARLVAALEIDFALRYPNASGVVDQPFDTVGRD